MSEKKARKQRAAQITQTAQPPTQGAPTATIADLLQLIGVKDVEIMGLQRQVAGLQQQVQMLTEQLAKKAEKKS